MQLSEKSDDSGFTNHIESLSRNSVANKLQAFSMAAQINIMYFGKVFAANKRFLVFARVVFPVI